jgi:dTDP-4-amino-4,6-dideoxygalactose transaminase
MDKIWLSSPHMGGAEQNFVNRAFEENWIAPIGPNLNGFEKDICEFTSAKHCVGLNSCTAAIHLALKILGVGAGDYVFVQSFTFCASVNPIIYTGATPVFIDSEQVTWNMRPKALREALEDFKQKGKIDQVKAIIPIHLYGMPAKMDQISFLASEYGIPIIEDAAESIGSKIRGINTGTFGVMGTYSFNGNKIITTSGGGALVSHSKEYIDLARKLSTQAREDAPHYQHEMVGYNYRLSNISAGIGRGQMMVLEERIKQRRANFNRYMRLFENLGLREKIQIQEEREIRFSNRWLTAVYFNPKYFAKDTSKKLRIYLESLNIESRPLWKPMHLQPVFEDCSYYGGSVCEDLFDHGLCFPSGSNLTEEDWQRIEGAITKYFQLELSL